VPVALKDNLCVRGMPTTAGSRVLDGYRPPYTATVVERLEAAGAVVLGKTNCDEFAMGSSTEHSAFGPSRNPWDPSRTPGGSSGGSAVAVAAGFAPIALGSDTGGSVRQPAALCGIVGLKPTYGRVSRYGLIAFASSLDQVSPFARTVEDAALVTDIIGGADPRDATCVPRSAPACASRLDRNIRGLRIGVPRHLLERGVDTEVAAAFEAALERFADLGAAVSTVTLPHTDFSIPVYYLVATAEASSNLARYDGVRYGFRAEGAAPLGDMYAATRRQGLGAEVKRRIMLGTYALSAGYYDAFYLKAQQVRALIRRDFEEALGQVDLIALPTSPTPAFPLGERLDDPLQMYLADVFTVGPSLAGLPAISVPCGTTRQPQSLPIGLQLTGRAWDDATVCQAAAAFERTRLSRS
jgi:aspartyl-tRNA(Asn)/glutamyl-tRNA(Gln) amidotransferase subunit A